MAKKRGKTSKIKTIELYDLTGGMNLATSPEFIKDNEVVELTNMEFDIEGNKLRTRRGLGSPLYSFDSPIDYIYNDYELNDYFIFLRNKKIYRYEFGKTPIYIGSLNGITTKPSCSKWGGNLLIASGSKLQEYNYQSVREITNSPDCDIVFTRSGRVVVAKTGSDLLIYSAVGDADSWDINSNDESARKDVNIGYKDGGDIVAVAELASDLLVFKSNGLIYDVQNEPEDWSITLLGNNSDFITRYACRNINSDIVFLSTRGLKSLQSSQIYANFQTKDIGTNINPDLKKKVDNPFISDLRRTKQMVVSGYSRRELFVLHYGLKAFVRWVFPYDITSVCENQYHVLVSGNDGNTGHLFELSFNNTTDNGNKISQLIKSKELRDTHKLNAYRTYIDVEAEQNGTGTIKINDTVMVHNWTQEEQQKEFKTQILSPILRFSFETDDPIIFKYISFDVVLQREAMVSESSQGGGRKGMRKAYRRKNNHDDFLKGIGKKGGSPYG
ncbi:hypothetical protein HMPREF0872_03755 [Veillonella montpellierensis DNF00314]|uniref:Uncharacterized protein n=1 Tax=Veillonella montpellierensis DNF00314 TaxID=1401067 RepID=A0A096CQB6_9FIRM|nr:hypothetical protein [Veillonella montpellierensis]KGF47529.1 hypothetical protein HMPREF0872_03755 [Veillonella montpellierensis DNF00314]